ncbi:MAG: ribonuclease P protein component [Patescibacteria group bacterium]
MLPANNHPKSPKTELILKFHEGKGVKNTIAVSKNVAKKAVDRNRIKRITREAARQIANMPTGYTVIIRKNIAGLKTPQIKEMLEKLL